MTWNISTIVAEVFYCIIGLIFIATGMKALKDESCAHRTTTALFWFILALQDLIFQNGSQVCALYF
mgnify:FL=1